MDAPRGFHSRSCKYVFQHGQDLNFLAAVASIKAPSSFYLTYHDWSKCLFGVDCSGRLFFQRFYKHACFQLAAARLAYDEWRQEYKDGAPFDAKRYPAFKQNYEAITIANVSAKKRARETGEEPRLMSMNEYGDCTAEEYQAAQASKSSGVLDKAVEAVESQSAASTALGDAAAALAEEEEVSFSESILLCFTIHTN